MLPNTDGQKAKGPPFEYKVVAVCDDDGAAAVKSIDLGQSFTFVAKYMPPGVVLFRLCISLTEGPTLYLQFTPSAIWSLEKSHCGEKNDNRLPDFDTVRRHLVGRPRSFTRLQFKLRSRGNVITPNGFVVSDYDTQARHITASIISLATASTFSLYMPHEALPKTDYQVFYRAYKDRPTLTEAQDAKWKRMTDLRTMYNGNGGALFSIEDQDRLLDSISKTVVPTIATDLPSYEPPPDYDVEEQNSSLPSSQQPTASDSGHDTIAASTPRGYEEYQLDEPVDVKGHGSKRDWSSEGDESNAGGNAKWHRRQKRRAVDPLYSNIRSACFGQVERMIEALEYRHQERIGKVEAEVQATKRREAELLSRVEELEVQVEEQQDRKSVV